MTKDLHSLCGSIHAPDPGLREKAARHLDSLAKPIGSLGRIEEAAQKLYCAAGGAEPLTVTPAALFIAGGDHGVWDEQVSPHPREVTHQMMPNILAGGAASSVLARENGMEICVIDAGHCGPAISHPRLIPLGKERLTGNITCQPAMTEQTCERLVLGAAGIVGQKAQEGLKLAATGEMGIANTTPATALFCALHGLDPEKITGPGTGLTPQGVRHKANVIARALEFHAGTVKNGSPLAVLSALGGFEIAAMTGVILGAASCRMPVLIDGFIATSAYAAALALCPAVRGYAFLCTRSAEPGYAAVEKALGDKGLLDLGLRLGEGTGCALAYPLFRSACAVFNGMATYDGAGVTAETIF